MLVYRVRQDFTRRNLGNVGLVLNKSTGSLAPQHDSILASLMWI